MSVNWTRCFYSKPVFIQRDAFMHEFFAYALTVQAVLYSQSS